MLLLLVPVGLATVIGLVALWPDGEPTQAEQAAAVAWPPGTTYPDARVVSVETVDCGIDPTAAPQICANAVMEILEGPGAGTSSRSSYPPRSSRPAWRRGTRWCSPATPGRRAG